MFRLPLWGLREIRLVSKRGYWIEVEKQGEEGGGSIRIYYSKFVFAPSSWMGLYIWALLRRLLRRERERPLPHN